MSFILIEALFCLVSFLVENELGKQRDQTIVSKGDSKEIARLVSGGVVVLTLTLCIEL